jgi:hypothetical protein
MIQPNRVPDIIRIPALLPIPVLAPIAVMAYWPWKMRGTRAVRGVATVRADHAVEITP